MTRPGAAVHKTEGTPVNPTPDERMIVTAARFLRDGDVCFVGIGLPNVAANLALRSHAPRLKLLYEAGVIGARPERLPLSIGDPTLTSGSQAICSMFDVFAYYLQGGLVDVGFLGAAEVDRFGNLNSTVLGPYDHPSVRLAGSGGACEISLNALRTLIIAPLQKRRFPARVSFVTSPGHFAGRHRENSHFGGGPEAVITDLGILRFGADGEAYLAALYAGATVEAVRAGVGWDLRVSPDPEQVPEPSEQELHILRTELRPTPATA